MLRGIDADPLAREIVALHHRPGVEARRRDHPVAARERARPERRAAGDRRHVGKVVTSQTAICAAAIGRSRRRRALGVHDVDALVARSAARGSRALLRSLNGLTVALANGIHSPPNALSSVTSGPSSAAMSARAPDCSSAWATLTAVRATGPSRSAGTICSTVAPASVRAGSAAVAVIRCSPDPDPFQPRFGVRRRPFALIRPSCVHRPLAAKHDICRASDAIVRERRGTRMNDSCLKFLDVGTGPAARPDCRRAARRAAHRACSGSAASSPT